MKKKSKEKKKERNTKNHDLTIVFPSIERIILLREKRWKETKLIAINAIHSIDLRNSIIKNYKKMYWAT